VEDSVERPLGRRETSKRERRARIVEAARAIFRAKGFEAATTREIAARAEIAAGTLFLYARDKHELLLMIVNDDLERLTTHAFGRIASDAPLLDQLIAIFAPRYAYWAADPQLSSEALHLTISADGGEGIGETARFHARRNRIADELAALIAEKQRAGRVGADVDPPTAAWVIMSIYLAAVRLWLADRRPRVEDGVSRLRELLRLALRGIALPGEASE
jgi:AcrR family transcriptional regulator